VSMQTPREQLWGPKAQSASQPSNPCPWGTQNSPGQGEVALITLTLESDDLESRSSSTKNLITFHYELSAALNSPT
jgi:hypothetical protein